MFVFKDGVMAIWISRFGKKEVTFSRLLVINMSKIIIILQERTFRVVNDTRPINQNLCRNLQNFWHLEEFGRWNFSSKNSFRNTCFLSPEIDLTTTCHHGRSIIDCFKSIAIPLQYIKDTGISYCNIIHLNGCKEI